MRRTWFAEPTGYWLVAGLWAGALPGIVGGLGFADRAWWPVVAVALLSHLVVLWWPWFRSWRAALLVVPALTGLLAGTGIRLSLALHEALAADQDLASLPTVAWGVVPEAWTAGRITAVRWQDGARTVVVVPLSWPASPPTSFKALLVEAGGAWRSQRFEWTASNAAARSW